nr:putative ORFx [Chaerephon pumilus bat alphacoronavirus/Bat151/Eswatini/2014]UIG55628.1 putative ORFx [Chaerephon pumilus bat alphacoronavirus/Bat180/Eswatini/2014]
MDLVLMEIWYFIGILCVDIIFCVCSHFNLFTFVSAIIGAVLISAPVYADLFIENGFELVMQYYRASHDKFVQLMFL